MTVTNPELIAPEIRHPLGRLRDAIRRFLTIDALLSVAIFAVCYFWISLLLDYALFRTTGIDWVQDAPRALRQVVLYGLLAALAVYIIRKWFLPYQRAMSDSSLALILENKFNAQLHDRLITAVELSDVAKQKEYGYSEELINLTVQKARAEIEQIPIDKVLNYSRLKAKRRVLLGLSLVTLLIVSIAVMAFFRMGAGQYAADASDVSSIWFERNILLKNTPWPRSIHLELVDFPGDEMRIGRDNPSPRLRVVAYKWVIADNSTIDGWRPLNWADLSRLFEEKDIPKLPIASLQGFRSVAERGAFVLSPAVYMLQAPLPPDLADIPSDLKRWKVDRVEQLFLENEDTRTQFRRLMDQESIKKLEDLFDKLQAKAADPANSRLVRKLHVPAEVALDYHGLKSSVEMNLRKESAHEFSGTLNDLKETVKFRVRGDDYISSSRRIVLVPPPMLVELKRNEYRPAYLYHNPPYDAKLTPLLVDSAKIKGLKQEIKDSGISLIGDRSRFDIPIGTEVTIFATVDKELASAAIWPKPGKYPGWEADSESKPIPLAIQPDHKTVAVEFTSANPITRPTEFELEFTDDDNVKSRRLISILPIEDRAPEVEVVVDVIRKVGNQYMCTAKAIIPISKDSKIRDDNGLAKVEFTWTYVEVESSVMLGSRAAFVAPLFLSTPQMPSMADAFQRVIALREYAPLTRSQARSSLEINALIPSFIEEFNQRSKKHSLEQLEAALKLPPPPAELSPILKTFEFRQSDELASFFDLRKYIPDLEEKDERVSQKSYALTLNVTATDTNVDTGPKVSQNKEPFIFKVVSEGTLLDEISREEATLAVKLDDVIRRLEDMLAKFSGITTRLGSLQDRDDYLPEQTRAAELSETLGKGHDITTEISTAYTRILREYRTNRFSDNLIGKLNEKIVQPLEEAVKTEFPQAEDAYNGFANDLQNYQKPLPTVIALTRQRLEAVLFKLKRVREEMGGITGIQQAIILLQKIMDGQATQMAGAMKKILEEKQAALYNLKLTPPLTATVDAGKKLTVKVGVDIPVFFITEPSLKVEVPPTSGLKVAKEIKFSLEATEVPIEIEAGSAKGEYTIRLIPVKGDSAEMKVIVK